VVDDAWSSVDVAVAAMRRGASDFIQKPWDNARLLTIPAYSSGLGQSAAKGSAARSRERYFVTKENQIIRRSPQCSRCFKIIERWELLTRMSNYGENGTGKGVVAQTLTYVQPHIKSRWSRLT